MRFRAVIVGFGSLALAGCATADTLQGSRSVFNNPYSALIFANGPVGPDCEGQVNRPDGCFLDTLAYPGRGRYARDRDGNLVRLTRSERRFLRQRNEAIQSRIDVLNSLENGTPLPPNSPALVDTLPPQQDPSSSPNSPDNGDASSRQ